MTTFEFLSQLRKSGLELQVSEDRLQITAPEGVITPDLKEELIARKQEILDFLKAARKQNQTPTRIPKYPRTGHMPLSYAQERLWFLDQLNPGDYTYNIPGAVRLKGTLTACNRL
jgi:hypothetical protein